MSHNGSFHFTGSPNFNPNGFAFDNSGPINEPSRGFNPHFNLPNYQHAGPSNLTSRRYLPLHEGGKTGQPYTGVAVSGDLGDFSHLQNPTTAPTTLHRRNEGYNPTLYPAMVAPRPVGSRYANSPSTFAPAQPCDSRHFSTSLAGVTTGRQDRDALFQVGPSDEESGSRVEIGDADPFGLLALNLDYNPVSEEVALEVPSPTPADSSPSPRWTRRRLREQRRHDPVKPNKRKKDANAGEDGDGWDAALARFKAKVLEIVHNRQPSGWSLPEKALAAKLKEFTKEELKRSPLQATKAGKGARPRDVEEYLIGILGEIIPAPAKRGRPREISRKSAFFEKIADELETRFTAVNETPTLKRVSRTPVCQIGQTDDVVEKNARERVRRGGEKFHLERMGFLFKAGRFENSRSRLDVLIFAIISLLWGSGAFSPGFVSPRLSFI